MISAVLPFLHLANYPFCATSHTVIVIKMFGYSLHSTSPWWVNAHISGDPMFIFLIQDILGVSYFMTLLFQNIFNSFSCDSAVVSCQKREVSRCSFRTFQLAFENIRQITSHTPLWSTMYPPVQNRRFKRRKLKTAKWGWDSIHYNLKWL